jgi:hypothetical protein
MIDVIERGESTNQFYLNNECYIEGCFHHYTCRSKTILIQYYPQDQYLHMVMNENIQNVKYNYLFSGEILVLLTVNDNISFGLQSSSRNLYDYFGHYTN